MRHSRLNPFYTVVLLALSFGPPALGAHQARYVCRTADGSTLILDDHPFKTNRPILQRMNIMDKSEGLVHSILPNGNRNVLPLTTSYLDKVDPNYVYYEFKTQPKSSHLGALIGPHRTHKIKINTANPREAWILEERLDKSKRWLYLNCDSKSKSKIPGTSPDFAQWKTEDFLVEMAPSVSYETDHSDEPGVKKVNSAAENIKSPPRAKVQTKAAQ